MKLSARNQLKGKIIDIQEGAVNGIVKIDIGGGNVISSTISMNAIKELNLEVGKEAYADKSHISNGGNRRIELNLGKIRGFLFYCAICIKIFKFHFLEIFTLLQK